jgi:HSP20 family molecular chaperone IbpA
VEYDYRKRGYLLPDGCKDLIDATEPKPTLREPGFVLERTTITDRGFIVACRLPELQSRNIDIAVEGSTLRISGRPSNSDVPFVSRIEVPVGYAIARARAVYLGGELRIVVPKAPD